MRERVFVLVSCFALAVILGGCAIGPRGINKNLFQTVAAGGTPQEVEGLLAKGANVNVADAYGNTPLHLAATHGYTDVAEVLIDHGADVNAHPRDTETPLFFASYYGHKDVVELLIAKGADVNTVCHGFGTPLHATACQGYRDVAEVRIARGANANANAKHPYGTPLGDARAEPGRKEVAELLIAKGADVNKQDAWVIALFSWPRVMDKRMLLNCWSPTARTLTPGNG
jgi:cytohesin